MKLKSDRAFESSFGAPHINSGSLMPHFIFSIITPQYNYEKVLKCILSLCFLPAVFHTVKQPIRAELIIEPHCETANQSRAHFWAALSNGQSEQSSTLLIMTLLNKVITDYFILGPNPRVLNGLTVSGEFLPLPKPHTFYVDIREQFKILHQCILWHL